MQVDQINSGQVETEEVDSETEQDEMIYKKSKFFLNIDYNASLAEGKQVALVCSTKISQGLIRIIFNDELVQCGKVQANEEDFKEPRDVMIVYTIRNFLIFFEKPDMKSQYLGQIMNAVWPSLLKNKCPIVGLSAVYKTKYTTLAGDAIEIDSSKPLPLRYAKTSHANAQIDGFLTQAKAMNLDVQPETQFNANGGLIAAFLMNAEMYGGSAITCKGIMDEHCITSEGLQAFTPVVAGLLGLTEVNMTEIFRMPKFKPVVKELNAKTNGIFN